MSSTIKQQPFSPLPYNPFTNEFYNQHQHRQSTSSPDNEQLSPISNNLAESSATSTSVPISAARGGGGGWYDKKREKYFNFWLHV
jgi:hypothetical protein